MQAKQQHNFCCKNTMRNKYTHEFWLILTAAIQGTSIQTKFKVIHNEIKESLDKIALLTYKLDYTYYNAYGVIAALIGLRVIRKNKPLIINKDF